MELKASVLLIAIGVLIIVAGFVIDSIRAAQAETMVELQQVASTSNFIWYLFGGLAVVAAGITLRRRGK